MCVIRLWHLLLSFDFSAAKKRLPISWSVIKNQIIPREKETSKNKTYSYINIHINLYVCIQIQHLQPWIDEGWMARRCFDDCTTPQSKVAAAANIIYRSCLVLTVLHISLGDSKRPRHVRIQRF